MTEHLIINSRLGFSHDSVVPSSRSITTRDSVQRESRAMFVLSLPTVLFDCALLVRGKRSVR